MKFSPILFVALVGLLLLPSAAVQAVPIYKSGHADIGVEYHDGELHPHLHFGADAETEDGTNIKFGEFEPDEIHIRVPDSSKITLPASGYEFTGGAGGAQIWLLPQSNTPGLPYVGLATEELDISDWIGNITFALTDVVSAPEGGHFSLFQTPPVGPPVVKMSTFDDSAPQAHSMPVGTHSHFNYGFSQPGVYQLELTVSGTHVTDGFLEGSGVFTFLVGDLTVIPEPSTVMLAGIGAVGLAALARRRRRT